MGSRLHPDTRPTENRSGLRAPGEGVSSRRRCTTRTMLPSGALSMNWASPRQLVEEHAQSWQAIEAEEDHYSASICNLVQDDESTDSY
jgi:hypothetical protein